jgi:hypothetical protein
VDGTAVSALTNLYAAFFAAQLVLLGIGLPVTFAVLLRDPVRAPQLLARVLDTWDGRLKIVIPIALLVFVAPLPAASGLVRMASAPDLHWPVDGWIVYLAVTATSLTLIWIVVAIVRIASPRSASPQKPAAPRFVASPPQGIAFVWEQGVRVIGAQLETADGLDRKITPLVVADKLAARYGGDPSYWAHMTTRGHFRLPFGGPVIQIHWFEEVVQGIIAGAKFTIR